MQGDALTGALKKATTQSREWRNEEAQLIHWHRPFRQVLDYSRPPFARWFVGGLTNLCHNAVDRHLATRADQKALVDEAKAKGQVPPQSGGVSLRQRSLPFLDMLRRCSQAGQEITLGV